MKKLLVLFILLPCLSFSQSSEGSSKIDSTAVYLLDHMSRIIGDLNSVEFSLELSNDKEVFPYGTLKITSSHLVRMVGPDKMHIESHKDKDHSSVIYDGKSLTYYSFRENNYVTTPAPETIIETIDSIHNKFEMDFPAADFFYPRFVDDLLNQFSTLQFVGRVSEKDHSLYHLKAESDTLSFQIWLEDSALTLPYRYVLTHKDIQGSPQLEGRFSYWNVNPDIPISVFEFIPPPNSHELIWLGKPQ